MRALWSAVIAVSSVTARDVVVLFVGLQCMFWLAIAASASGAGGVALMLCILLCGNWVGELREESRAAKLIALMERRSALLEQLNGLLEREVRIRRARER